MSNEYEITAATGFAIPMEKLDEDLLDRITDEEALDEYPDFEVNFAGAHSILGVEEGRDFAVVSPTRLTKRQNPLESDGFLWRQNWKLTEDEEAALLAIAESFGVEEPAFDNFVFLSVY